MCPEVPRLAKPVERTPRAIGPGSYLTISGHSRNSTQPKTMASTNLQFGLSDRVLSNVNNKDAKKPGPGAYGSEAAWNRRTYNLKFLNFNARNNEISAMSNSAGMAGVGLPTMDRAFNNTIDL